MTEITTQDVEVTDVLGKAQGFWDKYSRPIILVGGAVIVLIAGYYAYENLVAGPKEVKANEAIGKAQGYFAADSLDVALNGDGMNPGFLKVISNYSGTKAANLAHYYAGVIYLRKQDFNNAIKQLKDFNTDAYQIKANAYRMLGDAYMDSGKKDEGVDYYKKAGQVNDKDEFISSENLFRAGLAYETMGKSKEAAELYKEVKEKYPKTDKGLLADKYLARLGETE